MTDHIVAVGQLDRLGAGVEFYSVRLDDILLRHIHVLDVSLHITARKQRGYHQEENLFSHDLIIGNFLKIL
jgi:hypothetical protein